MRLTNTLARIRQKECNKRAAAALVARRTVHRAYPPCAPHFHVILESAPSCKAPQSRRFSRENAAHFAESRRVGKNRGTFGKKRRSTLPAQIQRKTIKVRRISYQNAAQSILIRVAFFLTYTVTKGLSALAHGSTSDPDPIYINPVRTRIHVEAIAIRSRST